MLVSIHSHVRNARSCVFSRQLLSPTARPGAMRRCSVSASYSPSPPTPPGGGGVTGGGGGSAGDGGGGGRLPPGGAPWVRGILQVAVGVLGAAGVVAAALPSVLSTQWGLQNAVELLNSQLRPPGRVEVAGAELSWLGGNELQCVKVYDSPRGGQILLHLNKVSTSSSLWSILAGSGSYNLVITKPWINAIYDTRISDFKLIHFMEKVGILRAPEPAASPADSSGQLNGASQQRQLSPPPVQQQQMDSELLGQEPQQPQPGQQAQRSRRKPGQQSGRLLEVLGRVNSKMEMNADVRLGRMNVVVTDGLLLVPEEVRQIVGPKVHITGAVGDEELRSWAEEVGEDVSWASRSAASRDSPPPPEVQRHPGRYRPGVMQVLSDHLRGEMRLWDATSHSLLHQPATASLDLTPELSSLALAAANPVLGNVVEVVGGRRLSGTFNPEGGRLPYHAATVEMEPVMLELGPSSKALKLLGGLGLPAAAAAAAAGRTDGGPAGSLRGVEVSRMRVHYTRDGQVHTDRVDMRLGGGGGGSGDGEGRAGGGVRLAAWGGADLQRDRLHFTLGVSPEPLLGALGLSTAGLPPGYMLLVPVRGAVSEPRYDIAAAALRLGQLGARQRAAQWVERERQDADGPGRGGLAGALAAGLGALVDAVNPPGELLAAIDKVLQVDMEQVPPPLSPPPPATS